MSRHFWAIAFCLFGISVLSAQSVDKTISRALADYFKNYTSARTQLRYSGLERRKNNIVVNAKAKNVNQNVMRLRNVAVDGINLFNNCGSP